MKAQAILKTKENFLHQKSRRLPTIKQTNKIMLEAIAKVIGRFY